MHHIIPRRSLNFLGSEDSMVELFGDGLENPRGSNLSAAHDESASTTLELQVESSNSNLQLSQLAIYRRECQLIVVAGIACRGVVEILEPANPSPGARQVGALARLDADLLMKIHPSTGPTTSPTATSLTTRAARIPGETHCFSSRLPLHSCTTATACDEGIAP